MATSKQGTQGTGKHPHKSAAEPYPHTKESGKGAKGAKGGASGGKKSAGPNGARAKSRDA